MMVEPPGQLGLVERLAAIERRIAETQRSIPPRVGAFQGSWWLPATSPGMDIGAGVATPTTAISAPLGAVAGCTYTGGVFTASKPGLWLLSLSVQWYGDGGRHWAWLAPTGATTPRYAGDNSSGHYQTFSVPIWLGAGEQVRTLVQPDNASGLHAPHGANRFRAVWLCD